MKSLAWHKAHWEQCVFLETQHRMPQALLLSGIKGLGKHQFAHQLGSWLLCKSSDKLKTQMPCGVCQSCQWMNENSHPEWMNISPVEGSTIGIDVIREAIVFSQLTPYYAQKKYILIEHSDKLTLAASHALLKTLEEPSDSTCFILVSSFKHKLLDTIKSRVFELNFVSPLERETLAQYPSLPVWALRMSQGAPLAALSLATPEFTQSVSEFIQALKGLEERGDVLKCAEGILKTNQNHALYLFYCWLIDLVYIITDRTHINVVYLQELERLQGLAARVSAPKVFGLLTQVERLMTLRQQVNAANEQLCLETLLIDYAQVIGVLKNE